MYAMLRRKSEGLREEVVEFARRLVCTPSHSLQEDRVADLVQEEMQRLGYDRVVRDEAGNVVGILYGREADETLLLNCHMDTVPPAEPESWELSPYSGLLREGRLEGLGASDCKGGLAAQVFAAELLRRALLPLRGNLVVAATVAEENGLSVGVRALLQRTLPELELSPRWAILGEPTGLGLYYGHDGWVELELRFEAASPFLVEDASRSALAQILGYVQAQQRTRAGELAVVDGPAVHDAGGFWRGVIRITHRLRTGQDEQHVGGLLEQAARSSAERMGGVAVRVQVRQQRQRLYTGRQVTVRNLTRAWTIEPFCFLMERARHALEAAGCAARPGRWELDRLLMGTAGSVLVNEFNIPTIGYGPGSERLAHARNEYVEVDKLARAVYGTACIAHALVGMPVYGWTCEEI